MYYYSSCYYQYYYCPATALLCTPTTVSSRRSSGEVLARVKGRREDYQNACVGRRGASLPVSNSGFLSPPTPTSTTPISIVGQAVMYKSRVVVVVVVVVVAAFEECKCGRWSGRARRHREEGTRCVDCAVG